MASTCKLEDLLLLRTQIRESDDNTLSDCLSLFDCNLLRHITLKYLDSVRNGKSGKPMKEEIGIRKISEIDLEILAMLEQNIGIPMKKKKNKLMLQQYKKNKKLNLLHLPESCLSIVYSFIAMKDESRPWIDDICRWKRVCTDMYRIASLPSSKQRIELNILKFC